MRRKAVAIGGALATVVIIWAVPKGAVQFQNLTQNGVRGGLVKVGSLKFVVYVAKSRRMKLQVQGLTDNETLGLMVTFSGRAFVVYTER